MTEPRFTCEQCGGNDYKVLETRQQVDWRRRRITCQSCGHRITTYEVSERQFILFQAALSAQIEPPFALQAAQKLRKIAAKLEFSPQPSLYD